MDRTERFERDWFEARAQALVKLVRDLHQQVADFEMRDRSAHQRIDDLQVQVNTLKETSGATSERLEKVCQRLKERFEEAQA